MMKYAFSSLLFFLFGLTSLQAQKINFDIEIEVASDYTDFQEFVNQLSVISNVQFSYSSTVVPLSSRVVLVKNTYKLRELLDEVCNTFEIDYMEYNGKVLFIKKEKIWKEFWLYGNLRDASSGEPLIGAIVYNFTDKVVAETNEIGYYSIKVKSPNPTIKLSFIGYESITIEKVSFSNSRMDFNLKSSFRFPDVIIRPIDTLANIRMIKEIFDADIKKSNPGLFGEKDIIQSLKFSPGVQSGSEIQGNLLVRGGGSDQNLILMDGVPLYEVNHLLGLTSIFNERAVNDVDLYTNSFDSKYGGRLSSVVNVQIKNGNKFRHIGSASFGLLGANLHAEGPLDKGNTSYLISGRVSYINTLLKPVAKSYLDLNDTDFQYQDFNFKLHHQLTKNNSLSFNIFLGNDKIGFANETTTMEEDVMLHSLSKNSITWGNTLFNLKFNQIINKKLFFNITASSVNYQLRSRSSNLIDDFINDSIVQSEIDVFAISVINDKNLRSDWEYTMNNNNHLFFGAGVSQHVYNPSVISRDKVNENTPASIDGIHASEYFFYAEDKLDLLEVLRLKVGFHWSRFLVEEEDFSSFQPRVSLTAFFNEKTDISLSYSKMTQYIHLLVNPGTGLPSDLWLPSTSKIPPEQSSQVSLQLNRIWNKDIVSFISPYYKKYDNLIDYQSAAPLFNPIINNAALIPIINNARDWEDRVEIGSGEAYGVDAYTQAKIGKFHTSIKYSYGVSNRKFEAINKGEVFPYKYDRRHDFSAQLSYKLGGNWTFGANFIYGSGHATTFATTQFISIDGELILNFSERNNFRLPSYQRLDLTAKYKRKIHEKYELEIDGGIYNAYNRLNPYFVYLFQDKETDQFSARQVGLFPILPFLNVRLTY